MKCGKLVLSVVLALSSTVCVVAGEALKENTEKPIRGMVKAKPAGAPENVVAVLEVGEQKNKETFNLVATENLAKKLRDQLDGVTDVSGTWSADQKTLTVTGIVPITVRVRFVSGESRGANWMALTPFPTDKDDPAAMIHAGVGETFYVHEESQVMLADALFNATVTAGDDDHLEIEVHGKKGNQKLNVKRDQALPFQVDGVKYELDYSSTWMNANENPVTHQAMIFVRRPRAAGQQEAGGKK